MYNLCDEIVKKDNSHKNTGNTPTSNVTLLSRKITLGTRKITRTYSDTSGKDKGNSSVFYIVQNGSHFDRNE